MPRRPPRAARFAAALCATALGGCATGPPDHARIGVLAPLSGPRSYLGEQVEHGARLAVDDVNDDGGLLDADLELVVLDDGDLTGLPGQLADLAERSRVSAVIGPELPGVLLGPRSPLTRREVPAILPTALGGDLEAAGSLVLRVAPSARDQAETLGRWLAGERRVTSAALLVADPVEGPLARADVVAGLSAGGVEVAAVVEVDGDGADLGPSVANLRRRAPDVGAVVLWGPPPASARATRAVRAQRWDVQVAVPATSFIGEYRTLAGDASEGVVLAFPWREDWFGGRMESWLVRYHRDYPLDALPDLQTLVLDVPVVALAAYDAVSLAAAAIAAADSREPADVADALRRVRHDGMLRLYDFERQREGWDPDELYVARFHQYATVYDVDPRLDHEAQRRFWQLQVDATYIPEGLADDSDIIGRILARQPRDPPVYVAPLPPPGPVA